MIKEIIIWWLPILWLVIAIISLLEAGAYAQGYEEKKSGTKYVFIEVISGIGCLILSIIFLLNL